MGIALFTIIIILGCGFYGVEMAIKNQTKEIKELNNNLNNNIKSYLNFIGVQESNPVVQVQMGDGRRFEIEYGKGK